MRRALLALVALAALSLGGAEARAAADTCTFAASGTWNATGTHPATSGCDNGGTIESGDRVEIPSGIAITTPPGSTITVSEIQSPIGTGSWHVSNSDSAQTTITMTGCNTGSSRASGSVKCGALAGSSWTVQGTVLHTSLALNATTPVTALQTDGNTIRLHPAAAPSPTIAVGDWIKVTSGPDKHAFYRISAVDFSGCPTAGTTCRIDFDLYVSSGGDEMAYGNATAGWGAGPAFSTVNRRKDVVYATGATSVSLPLAERSYWGGPANAIFDTMNVGGVPTPMDRCIEICSFESSGTNYACDNATVLAADGDYMGWIAHFPATAPTATTLRAEVVASYNDIACTGAPGAQASDCIADGGATVDRICFDRPMPQVTSGSGTTTRLTRNLALYPRFSPDDTFDVIRPVQFIATNTEWDNGLGFHGAVVDFDYVYFKDFAEVWIDGTGMPDEPQDPISNAIVRTKCVGNNTASQNQCANGRVLYLDSFTSINSRNLALIDQAVPLNVGPTGTNTNCYDADSNGTCDSGTPSDLTPDDGAHALDLDSTGTITGLYVRHAGDDGISTTITTPDRNIVLVEPYSFYSDVGTSTQCWEPIWNAPGTGRLTIVNGRAIRCAQMGSGVAGEEPVVHTPGTGSAGVSVDGLYVLNDDNVFAVANTATTRLPSSATNVIVQTQNVSNEGSILTQVDRGTYLYARNVGGIAGGSGGDTILRGLYVHLGTDVSTTAISPTGAFSMTDSIVANKPTVALINEAVPDTIEFARNVVETSAATTSSTGGFSGAFTSTDAPLAGEGFRDNLFIRSVLFSCNDATWGAANEDLIGPNAIMGATTGTAISNMTTNCTPAVIPEILSFASFAAGGRTGGWPARGSYGPATRVGVWPGAGIYRLLTRGAVYYTDWAGGSDASRLGPGILGP